MLYDIINNYISGTYTKILGHSSYKRNVFYCFNDINKSPLVRYITEQDPTTKKYSIKKNKNPFAWKTGDAIVKKYGFTQEKWSFGAQNLQENSSMLHHHQEQPEMPKPGALRKETSTITSLLWWAPRITCAVAGVAALYGIYRFSSKFFRK